MKTKEFNKYLKDVLYNETKKIIKEEVDENDLIETVKSFQTLSALINKISAIKKLPNGFIILINNITNEELMQCCGGDTPEESQKKLLQGLHYDMEEKKLGDNMDLDLSMEGENNQFNLQIKITTNDDDVLGNDEDLNEYFPASNDDITTPKVIDKKKKDKLILGDKQIKEQKNMKNKKIVRMTESELVKFLKRIITESENKNQPFTKTVGKQSERGSDQSVPGVQVTKTAQNTSKKETGEHLKNVEKKMKSYLSFDGNDNPEFPKQIGKGEKVARKNTTDQEQEIEDNRGRGPQDLNYDTDFAEKQTERIKKALSGDSTMGNEQDKDTANVIKSDVGKKMEKNMKRRQDIKKEEPLYNKEAVPTKTKKNINEDIEKIKKLYTYDKVTQ